MRVLTLTWELRCTLCGHATHGTGQPPELANTSRCPKCNDNPSIAAHNAPQLNRMSAPSVTK